MADWKRHLNVFRKPDEIIGDKEDVYLRRWWIFPRNRRLNAYLHHFMRSDDDRALHDHPWAWNVSIILRGSYLEHMPDGAVKLRKPWRVVFRRGHTPHRVELLPGGGGKGEKAVWTLFLIGPKVREWGFHCPRGWVHNRAFNTPTENGSTVGRGCE